MSKNPPWTRDELILALELYFRVGRKQVDPTHMERQTVRFDEAKAEKGQALPLFVEDIEL